MAPGDFISYLFRGAKSSLGALVDPGHFLSPGPLVVAFLIAALVVVVRLRRGGKTRRLTPRLVGSILFPRRIFLHRSARTDYAVFLINEGALFALTASVVLTPALIVDQMLAVFGTHAHGARQMQQAVLGGLVATVVLMLAWDFGATLAHYLKHRVPLLWEFHKVHHSATVLTPVTAVRRHPVDKLFGGLMTTIFLGLGIGLLHLLTGSFIEPITIFGALAGVYVWRLLGYNLRHSHMWISYGPFWERIFISPAQHQVHHGIDPAHHHKNFGHIFAFWDRLLGTLYVTGAEERVTFGVAASEMPPAPSLLCLYFRPFVEAARLLKLSPQRSRI